MNWKIEDHKLRRPWAWLIAGVFVWGSVFAAGMTWHTWAKTSSGY